MSSELDETLKDRGAKYGDFRTHAEISQKLKVVLLKYPNSRLIPMHIEALEMIFHKIARILNGDPNYKDSWTDIAGYAKCVADRVPDETGLGPINKAAVQQLIDAQNKGIRQGEQIFKHATEKI